jgi:putative ABC transport system permease protein
MGNDLRFGLRMLAKTPGFTALAVMALALGIGANTAIFTVVNSVMLQRMRFANADRLVMVWERSPRTSATNVVNPANFMAWQDRNRSFERIAAFVQFDIGVTGGGEPEVISNLAVSDGFFPILGVKPIFGRWFTPHEDTPGNDRVAILSEGFWRRRYGADPNILGRTIQVNTRDFVIVGVMPASFRFPQTKADLWQPMALDRAEKYGGRYLETVARLRDGVTIASAQAEMSAIAAQLAKERPEFDSKWSSTVVGLRKQATGDVRTPLLVLLGAVGLVLLIACANVANLLLMRAAGRGREVAIRAALGASAGRILRQLMIESALLALVSGAAGLGIGIAMKNLLVLALPESVNYAALKEARLDAAVFLFTAAVSLATALLFGLAPALKCARADVQEGLRDAGRGVAGWRSATRQALVVAEVSLSMVLLVGAGLLTRSFVRLASVDPGFDARRVISMQLAVARRFPSDPEMAQFAGQLLNRVRALPGVQAAGTSHFLPLGRVIPGTGFWRADQPQPNHGEEPVTNVLVVMPGYFAAMSTPLVRGRVFDDRDRADAPHRVVINQALGRRFYPNEDPLGKMLAVEWGNKPYEIIGVVGDVHQESLNEPVKSEVFLCTLQEPTGPLYLVARTKGDPRALVKPIEAEVRAMRSDIPISDVKTMDEYVGDAVAAPRFNTILLGGFSALAMLLAAVGVFGVVSYSVAQRTKEIGVRLALGADRSGVVRMVVAQAMGLAIVGIALGIVGALLVTRVLQTLLFGVTPTDPVTFAGVAVLVGVVTLGACTLPAWRAAGIDPAEALRHD